MFIGSAVQASKDGAGRAAVEEMARLRMDYHIMGCVIAAGLTITGAAIDWIQYRECFWVLFAIRMGSLTLITIAIGLHLLPKPLPRLLLPFSSVLLALGSGSSLVGILWVTNGDNSPYFAGFILLLVGTTYVVRANLYEATILFAASILVYIFAVYANYNNLFGLVLIDPTQPDNPMGFIHSVKFRENLYFIISASIICWFVIRDQARDLYRSLYNQFKRQAAEAAFKGDVEHTSHEMKTPLTYLILHAKRMAEPQPEDQEQRQAMATHFIRNAERLVNQLHKLTTMTKLRAGEWHPDEESRSYFDATNVFVESLEQYRLMAESSHIQFTFENQIPPSTRVTCFGIVAEIEMVISNLVTNAIKFSPKAGWVHCRLWNNATSLFFEVSDSGPGFSDVQSALDPYVRTKDPTRYHSTGIGLNLAQAVIHQHDGSLRLGNVSPEGGAIATVRLPTVEHVCPVPEDENDGDLNVIDTVHKDALRSSVWHALNYHADLPANSDIPEPPKNPLLLNQSQDPVDLRSGIILIVDDEPTIHDPISQMLSSFHCLHARNEDEALELAERYRPHVMLIDVGLPGRDGIDIIQRIKATPALEDVNIIVMSANEMYLGGQTTQEAAFLASAHDYIAKPLQEQTLKLRVCVHLELAMHRRAMREALAELKKSQTTVVNLAKMRTLNRLSAGLLHHFNNPLAAAKAIVQSLRPRSEQEGDGKYWDSALDAILQMEDQVRALKRFAHPLGHDARQPQLVSESIERAQMLTSGTGADITIDSQIGDMRVLGDKTALTQVLVTLFLNAKDAMANLGDDERILEVYVDPERTLEDPSRVAICFRDFGPGIEESVLPHVFDAFFTTKDEERGTGLGLAAAQYLANEMQGHLEVENAEAGGALFVLILPSAFMSPIGRVDDSDYGPGAEGETA